MATSSGLSVRGDVALRELLRHRGDADADADGVAGSAADGVGVDVGELGARGLGAVGVGVGDVVADHLEALARGVETGKTLLEAHGVRFLKRGEAPWRRGPECQLKALTVA